MVDLEGINNCMNACSPSYTDVYSNFDKISSELNEDYYYSRFDDLSFLLENYLINDVLNTRDLVERVVSNFECVLRQCDTINFESFDVAVAYSILHFLPRYRRFQIIYEELFKNRLLPFDKRGIRALDVGTGPAPALFALSDIYYFIFDNLKIDLSSDLYSSDYVERSYGFRTWLHHFTEYANQEKDEIGWVVPYHHGNFGDFQHISYNKSGAFCTKYRFNVVTCGNFLTQASQINEFASELTDTMKYLRKNGVMIVTGGTGGKGEKSYPIIYSELTRLITKQEYSYYNHKVIAKHYSLEQNQFVLSNNDKFGERINNFYKAVFQHIEKMGYPIDLLPAIIQNDVRRIYEGKYQKTYNWETHLYKKVFLQ